MSDYHDLGLPADLQMWLKTPIERRQALMMGLVGMGAVLTGCTQAQDTSDSCRRYTAYCAITVIKL